MSASLRSGRKKKKNDVKTPKRPSQGPKSASKSATRPKSLSAPRRIQIATPGTNNNNNNNNKNINNNNKEKAKGKGTGPPDPASANDPPPPAYDDVLARETIKRVVQGKVV